METERIINWLVELKKEDCGTCGGVYALTKPFLKEKLTNGGTWTCPYCGASTRYKQTTVSRLEDQLRNSRCAYSRELASHDQTKASLRAHKAAKTKLKKRVANGVCPCCKRHFENLQRHMQTKHPKYVET